MPTLETPVARLDLQAILQRRANLIRRYEAPAAASILPASIRGWTLVDDGANQPTCIVKNNVCSIVTPGNDTTAHLHAWVKQTTVNIGDYIECAFRGQGQAGNFNRFGLIMADGNTYNAGKQIYLRFGPSSSDLGFSSMTGFNTETNNSGFGLNAINPMSAFFMRLKYDAANSFRGYISPDGIGWINAGNLNLAYAMVPAYVGFAATTWGASNPYAWSIHYIRKSS